MTLIAFLILILAVAILVATITAGLTWRRRGMPGARSLSVAMFALDVWLVGKVFELLVATLAAKVIWANVQYLGIVVLPPAFLMLAAEITGRARLARSRASGALWMIPALTLLVIWTNEAHGLFRTAVELSALGPILVINASHGWWFFVHTAYSYALILAAVVMFLRAALDGTRHRTEALFFVAAGLVPLAVNTVFLSRMFHRVPLDLTPFSLLLTGLLLFVVILKHGYYDVVRLGWSQFAARASDVLIIINSDDRVVATTASAEPFMERSTSAPVGRSIGEAWPQIATVVAAVPASDTVRREVALSGDGGRRVFDLEIRPIEDGTSRRPRGRTVSLHDITSLKDHQERADAQHAFQQTVADVAWLFVSADEDNLDATINAALRRVGEHFGADRGDVFLFSLDGAMATNTHEWCRAGVASKRATLQEFPVERAPWYKEHILDRGVSVRIPDVDELPEEAAAERALLRDLGVRAAVSIPLRSADRTLGFIGLDLERPYQWKDAETDGLSLIGQILADSLRRVEAMKEMRELNARADAARQAAESANRAKSDFLASMSHELRTPLNAILGFAHLLEHESALEEEHRDSAGEIVRAGKHLLSLVNDVLDLASVESGRMTLSPEPVSCAEVVAQAVRLVDAAAHKSAIAIDARIPPLLVVRADCTRFRQVLVNLLSNAVKYNRPGGSVTITAVEQEKWVRIAVTDTGYGISQERMAELFTRFGRLGREAGSIEGTGIGLSLSRHLLEAMDGEITVESTAGEGSTFSVLLPRARHEDAGSRAAGCSDPDDEAGSIVPHATGAAARHLVLSIDDNPASLRLVRQVLARDARFELVTADSGAVGLELAEERRPAVVLVDINMPGMDGYETTRRARSSEWGARIPIIGLSANAMTGAAERAIEAGCTAYLTKPFEIAELLALLDAAVGAEADEQMEAER